MIETRKVYSVKCDRCGKYCYSDEWATSTFTDIEYAEQAAIEEAGWIMVNGQHICPDCQYEAEQYKTAEYFKPQERLED